MAVEELNLVIGSTVSGSAQDFGAHATIAHSKSAQVQGSGVLKYCLDNGWHVDSRVALAHDVHWVLGVSAVTQQPAQVLMYVLMRICATQCNTRSEQEQKPCPRAGKKK